MDRGRAGEAHILVRHPRDGRARHPDRARDARRDERRVVHARAACEQLARQAVAQIGILEPGARVARKLVG